MTSRLMYSKECVLPLQFKLLLFRLFLLHGDYNGFLLFHNKVVAFGQLGTQALHRLNHVAELIGMDIARAHHKCCIIATADQKGLLLLREFSRHDTSSQQMSEQMQKQFQASLAAEQAMLLKMLPQWSEPSVAEAQKQDIVDLIGTRRN